MTKEFLINADEGRASDRLAIADAAYLYGAAVDVLGNNPVAPGARDSAIEEAAALMAQALTPDAQLNLLLAGPGGPIEPLGGGGPRAVAEAVRAYFSAYGYVATYHPVSNVRVAFTGPDTAKATCCIPCYHWLANGQMLLTPVNYDDRMVRQDGVWRIARRDIFATRFWVAEGYAPNPLDPTLSRAS